LRGGPFAPPIIAHSFGQIGLDMKRCCRRRCWFVCGVLVALSGPAICSAQGGAVLRGRVLTDSSELAIAGVSVSIPSKRLETTTDSSGRFRMSSIPEGRRVVVVRRIGFGPITSQLVFRERDSLDVEFLLLPIPQPLPDVRVETTTASGKLAEFEERRRFGIGHFLDSVDIARRGGTRLTDRLRQLPGLMVVCRGSYCGVVSTRGQSSFLQSCPVRLALDGAHVSALRIDDIQPSEVAGIEWYAGPAQIPAQFNSSRSACGFLMIWLK
jgi:hypothetical protein